jgi:DNA adenine methylase
MRWITWSSGKVLVLRYEPFLGGGAVLLHLLGAEPFLRWAGGKRRLLPVILDKLQLPAQVTVYGADDNPNLINAYTGIRDDVEAVIADLKSWPRSRDDYNARRSLTPRSAAWAIWLNLFAFNGLWRCNASGQYNVPPDPKRLATLDLDDVATRLRDVAAKLQGVKINCAHFETTLAQCGEGDYVYCDPPYLPDITSKFAGYTARTESPLTTHRRLTEAVAAAAHRGARIVISNSVAAGPLYAGELFEGLLVEITPTQDRTSVGAKSGRGVRDELLIVVTRK